MRPKRMQQTDNTNAIHSLLDSLIIKTKTKIMFITNMRQHITRKRLLISLLVVLILGFAVLGFSRAIELGSDLWLSLPEKILGHAKAAEGVSFTPSAEALAAREEESAHANIVWKIYGLESSYGRNDPCKREGRGYNGFGFGWSNGRRPCYESFDAVVAEVHVWVENMQAQGYDTATLLCYYNTGRLVNNCNYYRNYLLL